MGWLWTARPKNHDEGNVEVSIESEAEMPDAPVTNMDDNALKTPTDQHTSKGVIPANFLDGKIPERAMSDKLKPTNTSGTTNTIPERPPTKRQGTRYLNIYIETLPKEQFRKVERGLVRKLDMIIMPLTMFLYLFSFLDKFVHSVCLT
jgi:hypothetical protein